MASQQNLVAVALLKAARTHLAEPTRWQRGGFWHGSIKGVSAGYEAAAEDRDCPTCAVGALLVCLARAGLLSRPSYMDAHLRVDDGLVHPVLGRAVELLCAPLTLDPDLAEGARVGREALRKQLYRFNDAEGRTHAEVLALFDAAIAAAP